MRAIVLGFLGLSALLAAGAAQAQNAPVPPASPPVVRDPSAGEATSRKAETPANAGLTGSQIQELIDASRATAKATRESVDYNRVVPDILQQILAKLDKIEDKLDKIETKNAPARKASR
jgi:hypothetical protein